MQPDSAAQSSAWVSSFFPCRPSVNHLTSHGNRIFGREAFRSTSRNKLHLVIDDCDLDFPAVNAPNASAPPSRRAFKWLDLIFLVMCRGHAASLSPDAKLS